MRKFTKMMLTLALLVSAVVGVNAQSGTKTPVLLLKNGVINTTNFDITPISPSTLTTDNLYAATFTTKGDAGYYNTFKYENLDVSDYDKAVVKYTIEEGNGDWEINLPDGNFTALSLGVDKEYVVDLSGVDTYGDFTVFSWNHTGKSITISEVYLLKSDSEGGDIITDFDGSFYHSWSEVSATAVDNGEAGGGVKIGEEVALGGTIWGNLTGAVPYLSYANITDYSELRFEGTPGAVIRLMCNRTVNEGPIYEIKPKIGEDGKLTVKISDLKYLNGGTPCDFVCLQSIKVPAGYQGGTTAATITSIKIVKPADPLAVLKEDLSKAINNGKLKNSVGKTVESFAALTTAIANGEAELVNEDATEESLAAATKAINDAIAGLKLADGYTNLTAAMYKTWDSATEPTTGTNPGEGCAYNLNQSTGQPYGDGSVKWYHYADISEFSALHLLTTEGTPRIMMNRAYAETGDGGTYVEITDAPVDGKVTVDLTAYPYAHMNAIKGANWQNVTITEMLLYRTITVGSAGYATFGSLDKSVKLNGVKCYAALYENGVLKLTEVTGVPAGKGVIIEAAAGEYAPTFDVESNDIQSDLLVSNGTVKGDGVTVFALANGSKGVGFYKVADGEVVPAGKAYLNIAAEAREFIGFGGEATGIKMVENAAANNGEVFNLAGQRVAQPTKGLYIMNGKKVVIK